MDKRISVVTLGCRDVPATRRFYEAMGWSDPVAIEDHTVFWQAGGMVLALYTRERLAADSGLEDSGGWGGVTIAYNVGSPEEVDAVFAAVEPAGGRIAAPPEKVSWGGYTGVFCDPEGHAWEVAHNPGWTLREDGTISLS
jgi:catechol 2,3-dioxygenase-like lactoylglutathione lyase family enzyme